MADINQQEREEFQALIRGHGGDSPRSFTASAGVQSLLLYANTRGVTFSPHGFVFANGSLFRHIKLLHIHMFIF